MEDYDECPEWIGTCICYYPDWDSRQNKSLALHKWGIDSSKDNSIDAAYNSVAEEIMHSFEDGLSSISVYDYEANLELLRKIKLLMDEKIEDRDYKSIKGRLMGLRKSFVKDFTECFEAITQAEICEKSNHTKEKPKAKKKPTTTRYREQGLFADKLAEFFCDKHGATSVAEIAYLVNSHDLPEYGKITVYGDKFISQSISVTKKTVSNKIKTRQEFNGS